MRSWYRKAAAGAAVGLLLVVAGCGEGSGGDGGDPSVVEWWDIQPEDGDMGQVFGQFVEDFNADNPDGAQVEKNAIENDVFKDTLATALQGGDPPDLFQSWGGGVLREQVEAGQVMDVTDELSDVIETISPGALEPYTVDGRVYGLPWNMGMVGVWYNTELFDQAGITETPETWSEFLDVVQQLKDAGITPMALGGADEWPGHFIWSYLAMREAGLSAFQEAYTNQSFDDPGFVRAGELLQQLVDLEPFQEGFLGVGYEEGDGQAATMGNDLAAMEVMGHWAPNAHLDWAGLEEPDDQEHLDTIEFFPFPEVEGGAGARTEIFGGGDGLALGANAPEETLEFVRYIFDNYQTMLDQGGVVTVIDGATVDDPRTQSVLDFLGTGTGFQLYLDQDYPQAVGDEVNSSTAALIAGDISPDEVVANVNEAWEREG